MARTLTLSVAPDKTDKLLRDLASMDGVVSLGLQKGASIRPPGDVLTVQMTNDAAKTLHVLLTRESIGTDGTAATNEPQSLLNPARQTQIERETNEATWPEMASLLRGETNVSSNFVMTMFLAGAVAAAGLWSDKLQLVVGAMVIAPGFQPIIRIPFGLLAGSADTWKLGLKGTVFGYLALMAGAAVAAMGLVTGELNMAAGGLVHWASDAVCAGLAGGAVFWIKRAIMRRQHNAQSAPALM